MKKIIIAAAVLLTTGFLSLYVNEKNVPHASATIKQTFYDYRKELASAD